MKHKILILIALILGNTIMVYPNDDFVKFRSSFQKNNFKEALKYIPNLEKSDNLKKYEIVEFLNHGIVVLEHFGEFNKALSLQYQLRPYITSPEALSNLNINISDNLCRLGQYNKALNLIDSLDVSPSTVSRKAYIYYYQDKIDTAITLFNNLLSTSNLTPKDSASIIHNIGFLYLEKHDWNNASKYIENTLQSLSPLNKSIAEANLAIAYAHMGNASKALKYINSALQWQQTHLPKGNPEVLTTELKKAEVLYLLKNYVASANTFNSYFIKKKRSVIESLEDMSYEDRISLWHKEKRELSKCFLLEETAPQFLYDVALFRRMTSLLGTHDLNSLRRYLSFNSNSIKKSLTDTDAAIEFVTYKNQYNKDQYAAIVLTRNSNAKFVPLFDEDFLYEPEMVGANSIFNAIKRDDPLDKNTLYSDTILGNLVWAPILESIPTTISNIYFTPEGIFNFWGIENMPFNHSENYNIHRISSTAYLASPPNSSNKNNKTLLMGGLNYSSIPADSISNNFSHRASELLRQRVGGENIFSYLPGTRVEVDSIAEIVDNPTILYQIGEANLKDLLPQFNIIHLSTHGYSLNLGIRKSPEFMSDSLGYDQSLNASGVALSGANILDKYIDREDGLLSAREICDLDLSNVDFVILSACQTAQGDITDEGSAGLVRGLKNSGVKTLMATLWSVDDLSTMMFMQQFYKYLKMGRSKHDAYKSAQNFLRNYKRSIPYRKFSVPTLSLDKEIQYRTTKYEDPYYWAPFILIDDF